MLFNAGLGVEEEAGTDVDTRCFRERWMFKPLEEVKLLLHMRQVVDEDDVVLLADINYLVCISHTQSILTN